MPETLYETDPELIADVLVGRRVVEAELGDFPLSDGRRYSFDNAEGRITLDDGTVLYLAGNDGGCACSAGDYFLTTLTKIDNVITAVEVGTSPVDESDVYDDARYTIFVYADNPEVNYRLAEFEGTDGNGYYGTGFWIKVYAPGETVAT